MSKRNVTKKRDEGGYIAVATVLLLSVFIVGLALTLDVASTRARASEIQRIADAAALAGATAMPDLAKAQLAANETLRRNDPSGKSTVTLARVPGKPGRVIATAVDNNVRSRFLGVTSSVARSGHAEQTVTIPMGTPYNSIGTGDLPGFIPGQPAATTGYFLAINGPCTAKEDGDRFMSKYDGTRGSLAGDADGNFNSDAYHCADYDKTGHLWNDAPAPTGWLDSWVGTARSQWNKNAEYRENGYSYTVDVPCDGAPATCVPGTPIANPVFVDVWDPYFLAWQGKPACADRTNGSAGDCVVDKVPVADPLRNYLVVSQSLNNFRTKFAMYKEASDGSFSPMNIMSSPAKTWKEFTSGDAKWYTEEPNAWRPCASEPSVGGSNSNCKNWYPLNTTPITASGRYRVQVMADPMIPSDGGENGGKSTLAGIRRDGGRSIGMNVYALRIRRAANATQASFAPCARTETSPDCATITGEGALSVYVRTPGNSELFLAKMAPASEYRGRVVQIQLFDPGEGANAIKILMPTSTGYVAVPFTYSTSDPGLTPYDAATPIEDRAIGWSGGNRSPVSTSAIDVSGDYDGTQPWPADQRYGQSTFNGRLLTLDVKIPDDYGKDALGADLAPASFENGWWKIGYESGAGVEDRTTWTVSSGSGPVRLTRPS